MFAERGILGAVLVPIEGACAYRGRLMRRVVIVSSVHFSGARALMNWEDLGRAWYRRGGSDASRASTASILPATILMRRVRRSLTPVKYEEEKEDAVAAEFQQRSKRSPDAQGAEGSGARAQRVAKKGSRKKSDV